jgi:YD repeat-containing protein
VSVRQLGCPGYRAGRSDLSSTGASDDLASARGPARDSRRQPRPDRPRLGPRVDAADRLLGADNTDGALGQSFTYDAAGNMLSNSLLGAYAYPAPTAARPHAPTSVRG